MNKFSVRILLVCSLSWFCMSCSDVKNRTNGINTEMDSTLVLYQKRIELIETILNLPRVIKLSKFEIIKKARPSIYILVQENIYPGTPPVIKQNGYQLTVLRSLDSLDTSLEPCYVFSRMEFDGDVATIQMLYDITGLWVNGKLRYVEGNWTPDQELGISVR